jgi:hypothetical protein
MGNYAAVTWPIKAGSEEQVAALFADYPRPESYEFTDPSGQPAGRLLSTVVFLKDRQVVRVIEFEGSLPDLMRHMSGQRAVRELEEKISQYLETPRDTSSATAFRDFFLAHSMRLLVARRHDDPVAAGTGAGVPR